MKISYEKNLKPHEFWLKLRNKFHISKSFISAETGISDKQLLRLERNGILKHPRVYTLVLLYDFYLTHFDAQLPIFELIFAYASLSGLKNVGKNRGKNKN